MGDEICLRPLLDSGQRYCPHPCHGEGKDRRDIQMIEIQRFTPRSTMLDCLWNSVLCHFWRRHHHFLEDFFEHVSHVTQFPDTLTSIVQIGLTLQEVMMKCLDFQFFWNIHISYIYIYVFFYDQNTHFQVHKKLGKGDSPGCSIQPHLPCNDCVANIWGNYNVNLYIPEFNHLLRMVKGPLKLWLETLIIFRQCNWIPGEMFFFENKTYKSKYTIISN